MMTEKKRWILFVGFSLLYIVLTIIDGYLTYLLTPDLKWEANPTVSFFGGGWGSLIIAGVITTLIYSLIASVSTVFYDPETVECRGFGDFLSKRFGKGRGKRIHKFVPVSVIVIAAGIISRIYVIASALLHLGGRKLCLWCALNIKHKICNCVTFSIGGKTVIISVVMYFVVGVLSVAALLIWLAREYRVNKRRLAGGD